MGYFVINKIFAGFIFCILILISISSLSVGKNINLKIGKSYMADDITFIEKSTGLNNPEKDGGKTELELADINADGNLDIICVGDHGSPYINSDQHGIMVWLGDGEESWSVEQVGNFGYGGIEAGDLNLDGHLDVVWGIHHDYGVTGFGDTLIGAALGDGTATNWEGWANGLGSGGEDYGMFSIDLADFDCNGLLDIICQSFGCCNGYHSYQNNGDGSWDHKWSLSGGNTYSNIEDADFNADGYPDFIGNRDGTNIFFGDGDFNFEMNQVGLPVSSWYGLDCGDLNNDGYDDVVIGYSSQGVLCYVYDNDDWVSVSDNLPTSGQHYPQFGDVNGDGNLDIVTYCPTTGYVYLGDGEGNWQADATFTLNSNGGYSAFVVDGDFDHDGREDIVIQAEEGSWPSYQNVLRAFSPWIEPTELTALVSIPHGGETFRSGSVRNIRWLSAVPSSSDDSTVEIQLSINGKSGPWRTIETNMPNNGCYQWLIDACGSEHSRIKIIVSSSKDIASAISLHDFKTIGFNVNPHGPYQGIINQPIQFSGSAENGTQPYEFYWDFGDDSYSEEQNPMHVYDNNGNFTVTLTVTDNEGLVIRDSTWTFINGNNTPPSIPIINGTINGKVGAEYTYSFVSTDEDNDNLSYLIDWGDGIEDVIGLYPSGIKAYANHTWNKKGSYLIKAKAQDPFNGESEWGQITVEMPKDKLIFNKIFSFLQYFQIASKFLKIVFSI